jgi:hypothetical protein
MMKAKIDLLVAQLIEAQKEVTKPCEESGGE